jgi:hypothetical protein
VNIIMRLRRDQLGSDLTQFGIDAGNFSSADGIPNNNATMLFEQDLMFAGRSSPLPRGARANTTSSPTMTWMECSWGILANALSTSCVPAAAMAFFGKAIPATRLIVNWRRDNIRCPEESCPGSASSRR